MQLGDLGLLLYDANELDSGILTPDRPLAVQLKSDQELEKFIGNAPQWLVNPLPPGTAVQRLSTAVCHRDQYGRQGE